MEGETGCGVEGEVEGVREDEMAWSCLGGVGCQVEFDNLHCVNWGTTNHASKTPHKDTHPFATCLLYASMACFATGSEGIIAVLSCLALSCQPLVSFSVYGPIVVIIVIALFPTLSHVLASCRYYEKACPTHKLL